MRRLIAGSIAFFAMTGTVLVLPVYAAPAPSAEPVATSSDVVAMGSVTDPAPSAEVQAGTTETVSGVPDTAPTLAVSESGTRFSLVGVTWAHDPAVTDTVVQIRAKDDSGTWGEWTEVEPEVGGQDAGTDSGTTVRGGTEPLWTGPSTAVEAELVTRSGAQPTDVELTLVDPGTSAADAVQVSPDITDTAQAAGTMPPVYSRAQWGADETIRTWDPEYPATVKAATVHHTAGSNDYAQEDVPRILRGIYSYHTVTRGWGDIGYNVLVDRYGRIWEGRHGGLASTVIGAHAGGFNTYTFGVSMLGNYDKVEPTSAMLDAVAETIAWKFSLYRIDPGGTTTLTSAGSTRYTAGTSVSLPTIFGHRDVSKTSCPGLYGYAKMDTVRNLVAAKLPAYSNPRGHLDSVAVGSEAVSLSGWAFDPNVPETALVVHVHVDGRPVRGLTAGEWRPDVGAAFPVAGSLHGFRLVVPVPAGNRQVCAFGINQGIGTHQNLGCRTIAVRGAQAAPRGSLDSATVFGSEVLVRGWALDDNQPTTALAVHLYVNGRGAGAVTAGAARPDVAGAFPGASPARGFSAVLQLGSGSNQVCAYAINVGAGSENPQLGCRTVTVGTASHSPVGTLSGATVAGRMVTLDGWSVDPDARTNATEVHVYVDGRGASTVAAGTSVAAASAAGYAPFGVGTASGYRTALAVDAGRHRICAYGINVATGSNRLLGCRDVTVAASAWNPVGGVDGAVVDRRYVDVRGWALDFDRVPYPIGVHLYLNGEGLKGLLAAEPHADAAASHPGAGDSHGFLTRITAPAGTNSVCAYGINVDQGTGNPLLGCTTFTVAESAYNPEGTLDDATVTDGVLTVHGWTYDPDVPTSSIDAHVYVDGVGQAVRADEERLDVALANKDVGAYHGYRLSVALEPGSHTVCAYAINVGTGTDNTTLGCRKVTV
ncbi:peptidoglycan recognition protein family protein [Blastococcus capsensis]|uniref:peptidoglycan recognition protein family protein n=1 Tax=Blastococcus capsensis TaxID=1564163 RepID=UPI0025420D36|nr:N-acetylmuramoyl-L-alanine amidase [Blastococcus capsensis]MDK3256151.1 N-acetylmuramoyl-L-alanine amidase [Blastococcus capsensis]